MILGEWGRRAWYLINRRRFDRELADEIAAHREMLGDAPRFGNPLRIREEARDAWVSRSLDEFWRDLRCAARTLVREPGYAITLILILSFGIGLNLAFFQVLNVMALRPPAVKSPETLVRFDRRGKTFQSNGVPYPATQFIRHNNNALAAVLTSAGGNVAWGDDAADRLDVSYVSANWFSELGYGAALGRPFLELDEHSDASAVIVVSHEFWRTRLQRDPAVVGRSVRVNDRPAVIIGVAPDTFPDLELEKPQVWLLIHQIDYFNPGSDFKERWDAHNTALYGRLRLGITPAAAKTALQSTIAELAQARPAEFNREETLDPYSASEGFRGPRDQRELMTIALLIGSLTFVVLLVTCANAGNLVLSHGIARLREFGVRAALGASRWRVFRQQLVESLLIGVLGAIGGLLLGNWCATTFAAHTSLPMYLNFTPDVRTIAATAVIAVVSTLLFGIAPAWMVSRRDLVSVMKEGGYQTSRGLARARFRLVLIGSQVAGCCVLLIVAGLMVRGLRTLLISDLGFQFDRVAVMSGAPPGARGAAARMYWEDVKRSLASRGDIESLALASQAPLGESVSQSFYNDAHGLAVATTTVEPSFFHVMDISLIAGRNFEAATDARSIIISRRLALAMYGTLDVLGKGFPKSKGERTIIGIAEDAPLLNAGATTVAEQYSLIAPDGYDEMLLLVRSRGNPADVLGPLRAAARGVDRRVLAATRLMKTDYEQKVRTRRLTSLVASVVGLLALVLACLGIFGVISYAVAMRTREIGIRRALGAPGASVIALLLRQLALPVGVGMVLGTAAGIGSSWMLARAPFYLPQTNIAMPVAVLLFFTVTAAAAAVMPASRALGAEPLRSLRHE